MPDGRSICPDCGLPDDPEDPCPCAEQVPCPYCDDTYSPVDTPCLHRALTDLVAARKRIEEWHKVADELEAERDEARAEIERTKSTLETLADEDPTNFDKTAALVAADPVAREAYLINELRRKLKVCTEERNTYGAALTRACAEIAELINRANDDKRDDLNLSRLTSADVLPRFLDSDG